jgi:hypothetical protein
VRLVLDEATRDQVLAQLRACAEWRAASQ